MFGLRCLTVGLLLAASAASAGESPIGCVRENDGTESRLICPPPAQEFRLPPPDVAPPVMTDGGRGLLFTLALPEPPATAVVILEKELASLVAPAVPAFPAIAVIPPLPPAPPAAVDVDAGRGLPFTLALPEPPATAVVIPEKDLASLKAPVLPAFPAISVAPPDPPRPPAATMPTEVLRNAVRRLKAGDRIPNNDADEVLAFYEARGFKPLWIEDGRWSERALALRAAFARADEHGLDPSRYRTVARFIAVGEPQWPALAAAEAQMTEALLVYARDAAVGRVRPSLVHSLITPRLSHAGADAVLTELTEAQDIAGALESFHPPHEQFRRLRSALAAARAARQPTAAGEPIPDGPALRVGMRDPRVPLIRERLGMGYDGAPVYDRAVAVRVASLQRSSGLPVNGMFTPQTRRALVGEGPSPEESEIIANMEFWRWMPRELGRTHIFVNTPSYDMQVLKEGRTILQSRIIVGKAETQTPFFSDEMDHIVVNPSWYIPPGILKREPKYLDPGYAAARGYEIRTSRNGVTTVRVPPSSSNALGYVKFMFPNEHSVYLHDTPNRGLFGAKVKTLSNGCVRVENPMQLAALLFEDQGFTEERFRRMQGGGERRMNLRVPMPVHLGYFTLSIGAAGEVERHPDVYGHAARLRQLLGLS